VELPFELSDLLVALTCAASASTVCLVGALPCIGEDRDIHIVDVDLLHATWALAVENRLVKA
jgi:hypothetical protein